MAFFFGFGIDLKIDISLNTVILVAGNFMIAYYVASIINTKNKGQELLVERCFKELESLDEYLNSLQTKKDDEFFINRNLSLINLQISLLNKYNFIKQEDMKKLKTYYKRLKNELTESNNIDENYKNTIMQIEKRLLVIKSNILN